MMDRHRCADPQIIAHPEVLLGGGKAESPRNEQAKRLKRLADGTADDPRPLIRAEQREHVSLAAIPARISTEMGGVIGGLRKENADERRPCRPHAITRP